MVVVVVVVFNDEKENRNRKEFEEYTAVLKTGLLLFIIIITSLNMEV